MTKQDFDKIVDQRLALIKTSLETKGKEYATDTDKLHNFRKAAEINDTSMERSLWGMVTKHLVSVMDMVFSDKIYSFKYINDKIGDMINYLILLEAVLKEEREE